MSIACSGPSRKNTLDRMSSSSSTPDQIFVTFFSKAEQLVEDYTHKFMSSINDFKLNLKSLQKSLMVLNAKKSDVEEQIKYPRSGKKKRKREFEEWLGRVKSIENKFVELESQAESEDFIRNLMDEGKVARLNEEVVMLVEESQHFDKILLDTCGTRGVELLTTRMVGEAFQEILKSIWSLLERREVSSIGIYGMGGVGKTALAKCINNRLVKQSKVRVFWITVSQEFTIKSLQDKIACILGLNLLDEDDEKIRAAVLHRALSQMKKSVLILDDLWDYFDPLKVGCPVSVDCCRLIITTRSLEVCRQVCCEKVIAVKTLCEDVAWKLFIQTLNPKEEIKLDPHVEEIVKSVARLSGGLPLGIITVAERMRGKTSLHSWTTALANLSESVTRQDGTEDVEVFRVLKHSFDMLNNQSHNKEFNLFQRCFLYCSVYPQGWLPNRDELIERFISEGLVSGRKSRRAQIHHGRSILDKLVNVCLLESYADGKGVQMHDLVRRMALNIGEGKYMARAGDYSLEEIPHEQEWTKDLEKVFLMGNDIRIIPDGTSPNCPKLSTFLLQDNGHLRVIPDSFFSKMKQLSSLDLCRTQITMLPNIVSDLTSLEVLLLEQCYSLATVPYLGKLKALRELNLSYTAIKEVPQGVEELLNLKSLSMVATNLKMLPRGLLLKLVRLQIVKFPIEVVIPTEEILNLKEVEQLHGRLNNVQAFNCFIRSRQYDASYQVQVGPVHYSDRDETFEVYDRAVFLNECNLGNAKVLGCDIKVLTIRECEGLSKCLLDEFSFSSYLNSLEILTIQRCGDVECILTTSQELPSQFSTLKYMVLKELEDFQGLIKKGEIGAAPAQAVFSSLTRLTIEECNKMTKLGLPLLGAPNLETISIFNCGNIEEIFEDEGRGCVANPKLRDLRLFELPRLKSVCKAKLICNSIQFISIVKCPRLIKKLPFQFHMDVDVDVPPPPTFSRIYVEREWWESLEWYNPNLPQLLKPFLQFY